MVLYMGKEHEISIANGVTSKKKVSICRILLIAKEAVLEPAG